MFYYFFINTVNNNLESKIDLVNHSPHSLNESNLSDLHINLFYSNGSKWIVRYHGMLSKNQLISLDKNELDKNLKDKSIFVCLSKEKNINEDYFLNSYKLEQEFYPPMRANIKICNDYTSASYQGEIPAIFLKRDLSLVSCSPMIQKTQGVKNFFYLVNLSNSPVTKEFTVDVLNLKKEKLFEFNCLTNSINCFDLKEINKTEEQIFIFKSKYYGGIPLYFSVNEDFTNMSIEHTHPPIEHVVFGDRNYFQRQKKEYWFQGKK